MLRETTKLKYIACIKECYEVKSFSQLDMRAKHGIDNNLFTAMHFCNCVKVKKNISQWTDVVLNDDVINNILTVVNNIRWGKNLKQRENRKLYKTAKQLTIKPIRKAPTPTPMPIVREAECDTSNSKMFVILAVGAIVGFMIATIIWK